MKLYTSYWARVRHFPSNLVILNTTVYPPHWYGPIGQIDKNGVISLTCSPLRPGASCDGLCNGKCEPKHPTDCAFLREYRKQLDAIDFPAFMDHLLDLRERLRIDFPLDEDFDFAFVFFETPSNPCSERWPVQDWFRAHSVEIEEWNPNI